MERREADNATTRLGSTVRCFKCRNDVAVMATREGPKKSYCVSCLVDFCHRTVRDTLFRHCMFPPRMPVVLCVSGGYNSMAMLHLIGVLRQQNLRRGGNGRIEFQIVVLHLTEDGMVTAADHEDATDIHKSSSTRTDIVDTIVRFATQTLYDGVPLFTRSEVHILSMKEVLIGQAADGDAEAAIRRSLDAPLTVSLASATSSDAEEVYLRLKVRALAAAAKHIVVVVSGHSNALTPIVLLGENGVRCCVRGLGDLVRGNGPHIPVGSAYRSWIAPDVLAMRPLRGLLPKEIVMYCKVEGVPYATPLTPASVSSFPVKSVNRTLEFFVCKFMKSFPSTPFNILNSISLMSTPNHDDTRGAVGPVQRSSGLPPLTTRLDDGDDVASVSGVSVASSSTSSSAGRVILSKASEANHDAVVRLMERARSAARAEAGQRRRCAACDAEISPSSSSELLPAGDALHNAQSIGAAAGRAGRECGLANAAERPSRPLCYCCQALQTSLLCDPNCAALWDEVLCSPWGANEEEEQSAEEVEQTVLSSMTAEEVAQEVAAYLV